MVFAVAASTMLIAACTGRDRPLPSGYLQVDINISPTTLDPRFASDAMSERVDELIYESMVRFDAHGNAVNLIAERVERPTPTRIVFHLRRGVHFSDGRELTAHDIKFTYDSILTPATVSPRRAELAELQSLEMVDRYTIAMTTRRPYAPALELATFAIVPNGSQIRGRTADAPPGSGPFRLVSFARDEGVVLARNPYRKYPAGGVSGLTLKIVPDATVRALELIEGVCDFAENDAVQRELIPYLAAQQSIVINQSPGSFFQYLAFNLRDARLRDVRVRRAIAYAIDREGIVAALLRGTARVATGMLTPENWAYDGDFARYQYDPIRARELLEEAGYGMNDRRLDFVYQTTPEGRRLAEAIQAMLKRVGIRIEIHTNDWATFYGDLQTGNFDLAASQWASGSPHQYYLLFDSKMMPPAGYNRGAYKNPEMDRLVEAGDATLDPVARRAIYAKVQQLAASELPYIPLWWLDTITAANRRLNGFEPRPNGSLIGLATAIYDSRTRALPTSD